MKRRPGNREPDLSSDSTAEEYLHRFFQKHPRSLWYVGIGLGVLLVAILMAAWFSGRGA